MGAGIGGKPQFLSMWTFHQDCLSILMIEWPAYLRTKQRKSQIETFVCSEPYFYDLILEVTQHHHILFIKIKYLSLNHI